MLEKGLVDRINSLARKQRDGGLTEEEKREQHELRQKYLAHIRSQVVEALESAGFRPKNRKHGDACGCETCASKHRHDKNYLN